MTNEAGEKSRGCEEFRRNDHLLIQQSRMAAMGELFGSLAHQWRQPLNTIGLIIQYLQRICHSDRLNAEDLDKEFANALGIIMHLSDTIDDFRYFLIGDEEKSLFMVDQLLTKAVSLVAAEFSARRITIDIAADGEPQVEGYPSEYGLAIINILKHAKDVFLERGTTAARIRVRCWAETGRSVVTITDNAGGISDELVGKVFDSDFAARESGTAGGLFIAKNIIEKNMGGQLTVRNVTGGAEFRVEV